VLFGKLGSLARLAEFFDHDLGSMLGHNTRLARPAFVEKSARRVVNRGPGVRYEIIQIAGMNMELVVMTFAARSGFRDELTHEGMDALYAIGGDLVRVLDYGVQDNNEFLAVNQFTVVENQRERRADIVLFINGLLLAVIELKNAADADAVPKVRRLTVLPPAAVSIPRLQCMRRPPRANRSSRSPTARPQLRVTTRRASTAAPRRTTSPPSTATA